LKKITSFLEHNINQSVKKQKKSIRKGDRTPQNSKKGG